MSPISPLRLRFVTTALATNGAGVVVDAIPVRLEPWLSEGAAGRPITPTPYIEDERGIPARIVDGVTALNAAGMPVAVRPVSRPIPNGYHWEYVTDGGEPVIDNGEYVIELTGD